jgi:hypothetical protein
MKSKRQNQFNYYWDWNDFSVGFSIAKPNSITGYKYYIGLDLGFFSMWYYFNL